MAVLDVAGLATTRRLRVEARARLIASQVDDGQAVEVGGARYWVTTAQGRVSQALGDISYEPLVPVVVRDGASLVDVTRDMPLPGEYTYIANTTCEGGAATALDRADDGEIEEAALDLNEVEDAFIAIVDANGRRTDPGHQDWNPLGL